MADTIVQGKLLQNTRIWRGKREKAFKRRGAIFFMNEIQSIMAYILSAVPHLTAINFRRDDEIHLDDQQWLS